MTIAPVDPIKIPSDPSVAKKMSAVKQQAGGSLTEGESAFSKLFSAMATEMHGEPDSLQGKLQELLETLQELPTENLTQEEQGIIQEAIQILLVQQNQLKTTPQGIGKPKGNEAYGGLLVSLEQTMKLLQQEVANAIKNVEAAGGDSPSIAIEPQEKPETIIKQLAELVHRLEAEQKATSPHNYVRPQPEGLNESKVFPSTPEVRLPQGTTESEEAIAQAETVTKNERQPDAARAGESAQPSIGTQAETAKAASPIQRPAATAVPVPVMRLAHAADDLVPVLQNSIQLTGEGENAQIKVNIFPEHLGHLDIRLVSTDGKIAAQIFTGSFAAKEVLDFQLNQLRNALLQQGVDVETIDVSYRDSGSSPEQQNQPDQRFFRPQKSDGALHGKNGYERIDDMPEKRPGSADGSMKVDYSV